MGTTETKDVLSLEQRLEQAEARLQKCEDIEAIRRLQARYCRALDTRDLATLSSLFAREAHLVVTPWNVDLKGHAVIHNFYKQFFAGPAKDDRHHAVNQIIEQDGEGYRAYCYFHATEVYEGQSVIGWGLYEDKFTHEDGEWKFAERRITIQVLTPVERGWAGPEKIVF